MHAYHFPGLALRRVALLACMLVTAAIGAALMLGILGSGGLTALEILIFALFVPTFTWIVVPLWTAVAGFLLLVSDRDPNTLERRGSRSSDRAGEDTESVASGSTAADIVTHTALAIPIHEERADLVAARVSAMLDGVSRLGAGHAFDVHLLSDSRSEVIVRQEEAHVERLRVRHPSARIHYRRRPVNAGRKAGNLAEFTARCRDDYDFMVVLDADSLMSGTALVELVRRMQANPDVALLQVPTTMIRARSLFARALQFAGTVYGPVLAAGQAFWQGPDANYWGHNAIIRVDAFADEARLPVLPGEPPLGGEVLSHDFVEAALLRRAGWRVVMDPTIEGSWEELPESLPPYARRDRRWAQGSLQHLRLLSLPGLAMPSRLHFLSGAMAYISSLLWLGMLLAGTAYVFVPALSGVPLIDAVPVGASGGVSLLLGTVVVLFLPKVLGLLITMRRDAGRFGGHLRLMASALVETTLSIVFAPVLMIQHSIFVLEVVAGRSVGWEPRVSGAERISMPDALRHTAPVWAAGFIWTAATLLISPLFAAWMSPIFVGLLLAPALVSGTSGPRSGRIPARAGLLCVPEETAPSPEVAAVRRSPAADPVEPSGVFSSIEGGAPGTAERGDDAMYNAERGLFDLKRGRTLRVVGEAVPEAGRDTADDLACREDIVAMAVEGLDAEHLAEFLARSGGPASLVVTLHRARLLGWCSELEAEAGGDGAFSVPIGGDMTAERVVGLAMDRRIGAEEDVRGAMAGPAAASALSLARLGRLLPAVVVAPVGSEPSPALTDALARDAILQTSTSEICDFVEAARSEIVRVSEAPVPIPGIDGPESSRFVLFREAYGLEEHVAVLVGNPEDWPDPVPIRLHSACLTGDLFGSLRCDCGEQLRGSMDYFISRGGGILLYLAQEGRGIGLGNKFRAYSLQETGLDTIDADGHLGFGADEREYEIAIAMLHVLGIEAVELLTNNPEKVAALEAGGITVESRQPLFGHLNQHNLPYVRAKAERAGHWLGDMLSQPMRGGRVAGD